MCQLPADCPSAPHLPYIVGHVKLEQGPLNTFFFARWRHAELCQQGCGEEGAPFLALVQGLGSLPASQHQAPRSVGGFSSSSSCRAAVSSTHRSAASLGSLRVVSQLTASSEVSPHQSVFHHPKGWVSSKFHWCSPMATSTEPQPGPLRQPGPQPWVGQGRGAFLGCAWGS